MKTALVKWLISCETDIDGTMRRFSNNEPLYIMYLKEFPEEPTLGLLEKAIVEKRYNDAFTYGHALKGLAGNLGFVPLFQATAELILLLRNNKLDDIEHVFQEVKERYNHVVISIKKGLESNQ